MNIELAYRIQATENELLLKVEQMTAMTNSKALRGKACKLIHRLEQNLAHLRDEIELAIESCR